MFCLAPKTREKHFCNIARVENTLKRARATIHPSLPPARPVLFRAFRSKPPSPRSLASKSDERNARARTRDTHTTLACTSQSFLDYRAHFPEEPKKKTREISPPTRRRDLRFNSRTTAFRRAPHKAKNETTTTTRKKGAFKRTMVTKSRL